MLRPPLLPLDLERAYWRKVTSVRRDALIGFWPLWERSGSVAYDLSPHGNHGAYVDCSLAGADFPDGRGAATLDGAAGFVDIYSAGLAAAFDPDELTMLAVGEVSSASVYEDGETRGLVRLQADANNQIDIRKSAGASSYTATVRVGGDVQSKLLEGLSPLGPTVHILRLSKSLGSISWWMDGEEIYSVAAYTGTWAGALNSAQCCIGALTNTPSFLWDGNAGRVALWAAALRDTMLSYLSQVP